MTLSKIALKLTAVILLFLSFDMVFKYEEVGKYDTAIHKYMPRKNSSTSLSVKKPGWKNILLWTPYFTLFRHWKTIFKKILDKKCRENRCRFFMSKRKVLQADAVLFHAHDLEIKGNQYYLDPFIFPKNRTASQVYVFYSLEPPPVMNVINLSIYSNFFNWTMTYRKDSDVYVPFGRVIENVNKDSGFKYQPINEEELKKKKMAMWLVSRCKTDSRREEFVEELQKYIQVDIIGLCGKVSCDSRNSLLEVGNGTSGPCESAMKNFVFYLALENSMCKDYISEKMYHALNVGVIPVVMGAPDYSFYAPPNSYIDVKDFDSVEDLANHLIDVSSDLNLYNGYFKWRDNYDIELGTPFAPGFCGLCEKLHATNAKKEIKSYESIHKWYVEDVLCYPWNKVINKRRESDGKRNFSLKKIKLLFY